VRTGVEEWSVIDAGIGPLPVVTRTWQESFFDPQTPGLGPATGTRLGHFRLIEPLGRGRQGEVWRALQVEPIVAGPYRTIAGLSMTPNDVKRVLFYARQLAGVVFLDVPCTMDDHYFQVLSAADRILLITEQKIPSLRSLRVVCDVLDEMKSDRPRILVVNRYNPNIPGLSVKKLEEVLKTTGFRTISNDYAAMNATIDHGRPLRVEAPRSRVLADILALGRALFPDLNHDTNGAGGGPLLSTLSRCLGLGKVAH
jgi:hypothetical protein